MDQHVNYIKALEKKQYAIYYITAAITGNNDASQRYSGKIVSGGLPVYFMNWTY